MRITLKAENIAHTNAIDAYVGKKMRELEKVLEPNEQSQIARITIGTTTKHHKEGKDNYFAEITFHVKKKDFRVAVKSHDLYAAIDKMKDDVVEEVKSFHARNRTLTKTGERAIKAEMRKTS